MLSYAERRCRDSLSDYGSTRRVNTTSKPQSYSTITVSCVPTLPHSNNVNYIVSALNASH